MEHFSRLECKQASKHYKMIRNKQESDEKVDSHQNRLMATQAMRKAQQLAEMGQLRNIQTGVTCNKLFSIILPARQTFLSMQAKFSKMLKIMFLCLYQEVQYCLRSYLRTWRRQ